MKKLDLIKNYVEYLKNKVDKKDSISWTDLNGITEIIENDFIPSDCEKSTLENNKCLSQIGHLCPHNKENQCQYK
jgi:hypothetical protein